MWNINDSFIYHKDIQKLFRNEDQTALCLYHHKKRKDSLETQAVLIEIFMLCWNLPSSRKHQEWLQKNIAFS